MATNAQRQAAFRRRRRTLIEGLLAAPGLPALPAMATMPGWSRWKEAMARMAGQLSLIEAEMAGYYDQRSERWQEGEAGEAFADNLEALRELLETAQSWPE
jgi:hypothetical protein